MEFRALKARLGSCVKVHLPQKTLSALFKERKLN